MYVGWEFDNLHWNVYSVPDVHFCWLILLLKIFFVWYLLIGLFLFIVLLIKFGFFVGANGPFFQIYWKIFMLLMFSKRIQKYFSWPLQMCSSLPTPQQISFPLLSKFLRKKFMRLVYCIAKPFCSSFSQVTRNLLVEVCRPLLLVL